MGASILKPGTLLRHGSYRIEGILGQGGFGITYLATDISLSRPVAVKEFFPKDYCNRDSSDDDTLSMTGNTELIVKLRAKFLKEARNIAKLDYPGIVKIHAAFEENNTAYYVMDYIEGETLSEMVKRKGPLSCEQALKYIEQIGEALTYIHKHRINHLDVKPANIMVRSHDDFPILIDFGLSKQYDSSGQQTSTTLSGISHGYAPLEQYNPNGVSEFSPKPDVYSLGATLYFLVSGKTPAHATEINESGLSFPPAFPVELKEPILKSMEKRGNRYETVSRFIDSIRPTREPDREPDKPSSIKIGEMEYPDKKRNKLWIAAGSFLGIALVIAMINLLSTNVQNSNPGDVEDTADTMIATEAVDPDQVYGYESNMPFTNVIGSGTYTGEVDYEGKPHGYGVMVWTDGEGKEYRGEWVHGVMEGDTKYIHKSGDTFYGKFKNNEYDRGRYTISSTGEYFQGSFKNGQPDKGDWYDKNGKKL